jgi:hypothetical protein
MKGRRRERKNGMAGPRDGGKIEMLKTEETSRKGNDKETKTVKVAGKGTGGENNVTDGGDKRRN